MRTSEPVSADVQIEEPCTLRVYTSFAAFEHEERRRLRLPPPSIHALPVPAPATATDSSTSRARQKRLSNRAESMALLCGIYACDRARETQALALPLPGTPECDALFLATWEAFRHVTTELGKRMTKQSRGRKLDKLEAFVRGREIPAHVRWAETESLIRAGEWSA